MDSSTFLAELGEHLSHLYAFARRINELDFAVSLSGEFRGMQDAGWSTTITAHEVFAELSEISRRREPLSRARFRTVLMLYCQLAEAGGVYESLKNVMGVVTLKPYLLWPFKDLVRVRKALARVVGPNANATFRDLAATARDIGMPRLGALLENAFRDDMRNGVAHADYVLRHDGLRLRLRRRNGGDPAGLSLDEVSAAVTRGMAFFEVLRDYNSASMRSFDPPKTVVGRFSANPPMPWTVACDPANGTFGITGSSPGPVTTPEYERQLAINGRLGGRVLATYSAATYSAAPGSPAPAPDAVAPGSIAPDRANSERVRSIETRISDRGFEPNAVELDAQGLAALVGDVDRLGLWDTRDGDARAGDRRSTTGAVLLASPWGFRWLDVPSDFDEVLEPPLLEFELATPDGRSPAGDEAGPADAETPA